MTMHVTRKFISDCKRFGKKEYMPRLREKAWHVFMSDFISMNSDESSNFTVLLFQFDKKTKSIFVKHFVGALNYLSATRFWHLEKDIGTSIAVGSIMNNGNPQLEGVSIINKVHFRNKMYDLDTMHDDNRLRSMLAIPFYDLSRDSNIDQLDGRIVCLGLDSKRENSFSRETNAIRNRKDIVEIAHNINFM